LATLGDRLILNLNNIRPVVNPFKKNPCSGPLQRVHFVLGGCEMDI
jgi:hypothetical protein